MTDPELIELKEYEKTPEPYTLDDDDIKIIDRINKERDEDEKGGDKISAIPAGKDKFYIKAKGYVGSISLQNYIINITPRFGWADFFKLIAYTHNIKIKFDIRESTAESGETLIDALAAFFCQVATTLIKRGLYRNYITFTEEITTVRGRMLLVQDIRRPQKIRIKHWCEFDEFSYDVLENQCILYCTTLLIMRVQNTEIKQKLIRIKNIFLNQDITLERKSYSDANSIIFNRMNTQYEIVIEFCKLILKNLAYKQFGGKYGIPDFTISMWQLFEKFVSGILKEKYKNVNEFDVKTQNKIIPIIEKVTNYEKYEVKDGIKPPKLKPDNIIKHGDEKLILDTKYEENIGSSDFYQATSYSLALECDTILLQPKLGKDIAAPYEIPESYTNGEKLTIHIRTIDFEEAAKSEEFIAHLREQIYQIVEPLEP